MITIYRYNEHKPKLFEAVDTLKKLQQALEPEGLSPALDDHHCVPDWETLLPKHLQNPGASLCTFPPWLYNDKRL